MSMLPYEDGHGVARGRWLPATPPRRRDEVLAVNDDESSGRFKEVFARYRWVLVILLVGGLAGIGHASGLYDRIDSVDQVRDWLLEADGWGVVLLLGLFVAAELAHIPGLLFVFAAMVVYGEWRGILLSLGGTTLAAVVGFLVVRGVGGQPLGRIRRRRVRKVMQLVERRPIVTTFTLRVVLQLMPAVTYLLAMSRIRLRDYTYGTLLGLAVIVTSLGLFFDWLKEQPWFEHLL
jgi:uncharacterized membrane protein YdjX (TVP38/TMEM64 family)